RGTAGASGGRSGAGRRGESLTSSRDRCPRKLRPPGLFYILRSAITTSRLEPLSRPASIRSLPHIPALLGAIFLGILTPSALLAQAGSFPAMTFERGSSWQYLAELSEGVRIGSAVTAPQRPRGILKLSSDQRYVVWVELERGRLNLLEQQPDGSLEVRKVMPVSIGKNGIGKEVEGDKLTPVGVYRLTSFLADSTLDDFYGNGAYPMNYPNAHDRLLKRTGHGIWLHGL